MFSLPDIVKFYGCSTSRSIARRVFPVTNDLDRRDILFVSGINSDYEVRERFPEVPVYLKPADMAATVLTSAAVVTERSRPQ